MKSALRPLYVQEDFSLFHTLPNPIPSVVVSPSSEERGSWRAVCPHPGAHQKTPLMNQTMEAMYSFNATSALF
jgi:hypothetical protein